ncbi:hypothetical protein [Aeromonas dhakensis]|uniref:hypothetical protein n=1 Tax=Aeromonas dhakensis TaxID=196024 RepID=UPI0039887634
MDTASFVPDCRAELWNLLILEKIARWILIEVSWPAWGVDYFAKDTYQINKTQGLEKRFH